MAAQSKLQLVIEGVDKASGPLGKVTKSVEDMGARSNSSGSSLKALGATALKVTASLAAVGFAAKKAFDLGKEGAAIKQTGQSFEFLIKKVGASADLLGQLRTAAKGTISDMDLMSSTATLLAGAQGDLAKELAISTPRLLEVAKAAQKLNPSLGSTTFLYDSLALGVKRASPMILDNLGLTIRIGEANAKYAIELGKTVAELTANELKQALLNETLRAGAVLIEQAGGTTESATDSYNQFSAAIDNLTDTYKIMAAEALAPTMGLMAEFARKTLDAVGTQQTLNQAVKDGILTYAEAGKAIMDMRRGLISAEDAMQIYTDAERKARHEGTLHAEQQVVLRKTLHDTTAEVMEASRAQALLADSAARLASDVYSLAGAEEVVQLESKELAQILKDDLAIATEKTTQEIIDAEKELRELTAEFLESGIASKEAAQKITALAIDIEEMKTKVDTAVPSVHDLSLALGGIASAWDQAKIAMAPGLSLLEDIEEQIIDTSDSTEDWARIEDDVAVAIGEKNKAIVTAERRLRTLERQVEDNIISFDDSRQAIFLAKVALEEANKSFSESNDVIGDNTSILRDNSTERERQGKLADAIGLIEGRLTEKIIATRDATEAMTRAWVEQGEASGFTEGQVALANAQYNKAIDTHRQLARETRGVTAATMDLGVASISTGMSVLAMRQALIVAGGSYWSGASDAQITGEFQRLADVEQQIKSKSEDFPLGSFEEHPFTAGKGFAGMSAEDWVAEYSHRLMQDYPRAELPGLAMGSDMDPTQRARVIQMMKDRDLPFVSGEPFIAGRPGAGNVASGQKVQMSAAQYEAEYGWRREHPGMEMPTLAAHGANFMVPPHYPNDSFMMGVSSGERVSVTPSHMLGGGNGGGMTVNTINVYGVQTASALYEEVVKAARQRGRAFTKVM